MVQCCQNMIPATTCPREPYAVERERELMLVATVLLLQRQEVERVLLLLRNYSSGATDAEVVS